MFCFEFRMEAVQCFHGGNEEEPLCPTCAVRHTIEKHPFVVATQVIDYSSLMRPGFLSKTNWWITAKLHLQQQIQEICPETKNH